MTKDLDGTAPRARGTGGARSSARRGLACCAVALWALAGCSGGSKATSGAGSAGLTVSPGSVAYAAAEQDPPPAAQVFRITIDNSAAAYVGAWFPGTDPGWLALDLSGTGSSWTLRTSIRSTTGVPPGTHRTTVRVAIADANQAVLATQDVTVEYTLTAKLRAAPGSLGFSAPEAGPVSAAQVIQVSGAGLEWTASASDSWIRLDRTSGAGPGDVQVSADPAHLTSGTYTGTVTFQAAGQTAVPVTVRLDVAEAAFTVGRRLAFSGKNGVPLPAQSLQLALNNGAAVEWSAVASAPWIVLDRTFGSTPGTLTVGIDATKGPLASGMHTGTVSLSGAFAGRTVFASVEVALTLVKPVLSLSPSSVALGGAVGRDLQARQVALSLDTGTVAFPWAASTPQAWIAPSTAVGTVSATPSTISVGPDVAGLAGGTRDGSLQFSVAVNGDIVTAALPVRLDLDDRRLLVNDTGVAFAKTPSLASLSRTLKVTDNFGAPTGWTATASEAWLTVTQNGTAPGDLVITADPTNLATDTVHLATVTVSPTGVAAPAEEIRVGLWVGARDPTPATVLDVATTAVVTDPVRPYAYAHAGGTTITVYNVFTAKVVATIAGVAAQLGSMAVAPDGSRLYAVDRTNFRIVPVDLVTRTVGTPFAVGAAVGPEVFYTRTDGKGLVLAGNGCIYDGATGAVRYPAGGCTATSSGPVSSSVAGNIFSIGSTAYRLDYTAAGGGRAVVGEPLFPQVTMWNSADYAFNADGSRMYLAVKAPYDFYVVDTTVAGTSLPQVQVLPGNAYPNNIEVARDGRIFAAIDGYADSAGHDAWIFSPDGVMLKAFALAYYGVSTGNLRVSGDGLRMVSLPQGNSLTPVAIGFHTTVP